MIVIPFSRLEGSNILPEVVAGLGVETECRFVEEKDRGVVEQSPGNLEAPAHAAGERLDNVVFPIRELDKFQEFIDSRIPDF